MTPKISVIVPVYNTEKYLRRCVDSILAQTFTDFELLLIDDGSTDSSGAICDEYAQKDSRVRVFHKENGGVSSARNLGLNKAKGEYIAFVDGDDWISSDMYESLLNKIKNEEADIVYCDFFFVYANDTLEYRNLNQSDDRISFIKKYMTTGWTSMCNMLINRNLFFKWDLEFIENICVCEDFNLSVKLYFYAERIAKVDKCLYYYNRINENSTLHNYTKDVMLNEMECYNDIQAFFERKGVLTYFIKELSWKIQCCQSDYILDESNHDEFIKNNINFKSNILSNPLINNKIKIIMWLLMHRLSCIASLIIRGRNKLYDK